MRERVERIWSRAEAAVAPFRDPPPVPAPYSPDDPAIRRRLYQSAVLGFIGSTLIFVGASLSTSPFAEKISPSSFQPGPYTPAWFFGAARPGSVIFSQNPTQSQSFYWSLLTFYGGMVLLMQAWIRLSRLARERPGLPLKALWIVMAAWTLPMLFVEPLLSKDAFSYVAQGEMMTRHISPYRLGPAVLGLGSNSYTILTDKLWWYSTSPYGPVFLGLADVIQGAVNHSELWALVGWRLVAICGVALIGIFLPRLARRIGKEPSPAFVFAVMNPIVLIHLIGGEHNDAVMLGFLVAGLALASENHKVIGTVLVTIAALVKAPALLGVVYIGWDWAGVGAPLKQRAKALAKAGAVSVVVMAAVTEAVGIGWGWVAGLTNPDAVRSWLDPVTALGLALGDLAKAVGYGHHAHLILTGARGAGALAAVVIGLVLLFRSRGGASSLRAIGLTMLLVVLLGPVMQPWYLAWGVVLLAPVATGTLRGVLVWLTVVVTFLGLGDAQYILIEMGKANPLVVALSSVLMAVILIGPLVPKLRRGLDAHRHRVPAGLDEKLSV